LTCGLTAGDYFLAVADGSNTPSPLEGQPPGTSGVLDPNQSHSAQLGVSAGPYVLNLSVQPAPNPPQVVASSPASGQVLDQAPTQLTVQFSEPVDIQQLAFQASEMTAQATLPEVFVEGADGTRYYPRFLSYDRSTNTATFQMLDGLADGSYVLHLSGPGGLTDLGGNPLVSNDASGDYVIPFTVEGPDRGISGDMADGYTIVSQVGQTNPQPIGILFPDELQAGVTIRRGPESTTSPTAYSLQDEYVIQILQSQVYSFTLGGDDLPAGIQVSVETNSGQVIDLSPSFDQLVFLAPLRAGTYTVILSGWSPDQCASLSYQLTVSLFGEQDNAPPLVDGPAPLIQIQLVGLAGGVSASPSGSGVMGPVTGEGGGSGSATGTPVGEGPSAGSPSDPSTVIPASVSSALTLTGLGMSPLGGVGGVEAGTAATATVQVALGPSPSPGLPFGGMALTLVTLTQLIPLRTDGGGIAPVQPPDDETPPESDQPGPSTVEAASADAAGTVSAGDPPSRET
jgi:hypothetical protein